MAIDVLKAGMDYVIASIAEIIGCDIKSVNITKGMFGYTYVEYQEWRKDLINNDWVFCMKAIRFGIKGARDKHGPWGINVCDRQNRSIYVTSNDIACHNRVIDKLKAWLILGMISKSN